MWGCTRSPRIHRFILFVWLCEVHVQVDKGMEFSSSSFFARGTPLLKNVGLELYKQYNELDYPQVSFFDIVLISYGYCGT
jgi:hypothetical protein